MENDETLGDRLRQWRDFHDLSYGKLADAVNENLPEDRQIHRVTFHDWEKQERPSPSPDRLRAILRAFPSMRTEWLLWGEGSPVVTKEEMEEKVGGQRTEEGLLDQIKREHPKVRQFDAATRELLVSVLTDWALAFEDGGDVSDEKLVEMAGALLHPIRAFTEGVPGFRTAGEDGRGFQQFARATLQALSLHIRGRGEAGPVEHAPGTMLESLLEAQEERLAAAREALSD